MIAFGKGIFSWLLAAAALAPGGAVAQDLTNAPVPTESPSPETAYFDVAVGAAFTTNYISHGITNSGNSPAIQGYVEPSFDWAYLNVWSSNVDYGEGFEGAEIDVALGIRPEFGPLSFDLGYVHYFYTP